MVEAASYLHCWYAKLCTSKYCGVEEFIGTSLDQSFVFSDPELLESLSLCLLLEYTLVFKASQSLYCCIFCTRETSLCLSYWKGASQLFEDTCHLFSFILPPANGHHSSSHYLHHMISTSLTIGAVNAFSWVSRQGWPIQSTKKLTCKDSEIRPGNTAS